MVFIRSSSSNTGRLLLTRSFSKFRYPKRASAAAGRSTSAQQPNEYSLQQPPTQPPPTYYQQPPQYQEPSLGTSMLHYLVLGLGLSFGIALVRIVFSEGKYVEDDLEEKKQRN